jgi:hypothetical protein
MALILFECLTGRPARQDLAQRPWLAGRALTL